MDNWLTKLTSEHVNNLKPYESARRLFSAADSSACQERVWMNANESPFSAQYSINSQHFNRYPDCQPEELIQAYSEYADLDKSHTMVTRGADEGIELVIRAFCEPNNGKILICPPTYGMYAISAKTFNVGVSTAPLTPDFGLDISLMKKHIDDVNVVFICSPNNPTGTSSEHAHIIEVLELFKNKAIVVVDEAYIEFDHKNTCVTLLKQYSNLVILRTMSKAFGLAGLRCGFALTSPQIVKILLKVIAPYPISAPVAQIATTALNELGIQRMKSNTSLLNQSLNNIKEAITSIPEIDIIGDIKGNFLLFRTENSADLMSFLVKHNVLIRDQSKQLQLENCLRISVGDEMQNEQLLTLIKTFFAGVRS